MALLPYVTSPGNIDKALAGIKRAAVPDRVSQDFVKTILKIPGGSGAQMTSFMRKIGLSNTDGTPSELYKKFRNPTESAAAAAAILRHGYSALYVRNEFAHELPDEALLGLIMEETGQPHDASGVKLTHACFKHLRAFADFSSPVHAPATPPPNSTPALPDRAFDQSQPTRQSPTPQSLGLNLGYTINLNLPATSDPEVFDAIFKSLKQHLLGDDDA